METPSTSDNTVALIRYRSDETSLAKAIDFWQGLQGITTKTQVLIKPNLVFWDDSFPFSPYGVLTTTNMMEALLVCLKEKGSQKITTGEGTTRDRRMNVSTQIIYQRFEYDRFIKRYGVRLVGFLDEPFFSLKQDGIRLGIAKSVLEDEFLITVPTLKTHSQTKVSLMKEDLWILI